jgi:hypothetical protein
MGYRSDVFIALTEKNVKKMVQVLSDEIILELLQGCDRYEKNGWTLFRWPDVKWYDGYELVDGIMTFLADLEDSEDPEENEGYSLTILGEDQDDYTQKGAFDTPFGIRLVRQIEFDL